MLFRFSGLWLALVFLAAPALAADGVIAPSSVDDGAVVWSPELAFTEATLDLSGPDGMTLRRGFAPAERIVFAPADLEGAVPDGLYRYDLTFVTGGEPTADGTPALQGAQQSGTFEVAGGLAIESAARMDYHTGDGNIVGDVCVGAGCGGYAAHGIYEMTMRANNVRVLYDDNSATTTLPDHDWAIIINDTFAGGREYYAVRDETNSRTVFTVEAGAREDALYVDNTSRIGIGERDPVEDLHMLTSDTPTIRLDQQGAFGDQAFDMGGNETNFFVRDVQANTLPIRLLDDTPTGMLGITPDGVGINTNDAIGNINIQASLDVNGDALVRTDLNVRGDSRVRGDSLRVEGITATDRIIVGADEIDLPNIPTDATVDVAGFSRFRDRMRIGGNLDLDGDFVTQGKIIGRGQLNFVGDYQSSPAPVLRVLDQVSGDVILISLPNGNLVIGGTLIQVSDENVKENILPIDPESVLQGVAGMPMSTWEYINDQESAVHLGPMAQDFRAAFGLGQDNTTIASVDADGVALASVQALHARSETDRVRIAELEAENAALAERLTRIEALLTETPGSDD